MTFVRRVIPNIRASTMHIELTMSNVIENPDQMLSVTSSTSMQSLPTAVDQFDDVNKLCFMVPPAHSSINMKTGDASAKPSPNRRRPTGTPGSSKAGKRMFGCPLCRYATDRKNNLKRHLSTMHRDCIGVAALISGNLSPSVPLANARLSEGTVVNAIGTDLRYHRRNLECCNVVYDNKTELHNHVTTHHVTGYACEWCDRCFSRKAPYRRHLSAAHRTTTRGDQIQLSKNDDVTTSNSFCEKAVKQFSQEQRQIYHFLLEQHLLQKNGSGGIRALDSSSERSKELKTRNPYVVAATADNVSMSPCDTLSSTSVSTTPTKTFDWSDLVVVEDKLPSKALAATGAPNNRYIGEPATVSIEYSLNSASVISNSNMIDDGLWRQERFKPRLRLAYRRPCSRLFFYDRLNCTHNQRPYVNAANTGACDGTSTAAHLN